MSDRKNGAGHNAREGGSFLEIRDLSLRRGEREVLDGFHLSISRGEIFGLLGPNGAGKSSAFQALVGLLPADSGELVLDGRAAPLGSPRIRGRMGVVFQSPALDGRLSARDNLVLAAGLYGIRGGAARDRAEEMIAFADLEGRDREPVKRLSGGMRRRLEIARSLLNRPDFLLMDEPTTGLDTPSFEHTWATLRRLSREDGVTILLTTHRADEAERCDRLAFLDGGRIVATGAPDELRDRVGGDVIELAAGDPGAAAGQVREALGVSAEVVGERVRIVADRAHELVPRIVEALPAGSLSSVAFHRPGLSDVFLALTGRALEADADGEEVAA
jgi:ABC-2 type transport system ATP-binding protein